MSKIHRTFPPIASALRETLAEGYGRADLLKDFWAGISVGIIAVPLSLALAIASGVAGGKRAYFESTGLAVARLKEAR